MLETMFGPILTVTECESYDLFFKFTHDFHLMSKLQLHHISLGLVYLHSKKIIHGDLKAVNIIPS